MKKFALSDSVITLRSIQASIAFLFLVLVAGQPLTAQEKYTLKSGYASGKYETVCEYVRNQQNPEQQPEWRRTRRNDGVCV